MKKSERISSFISLLGTDPAFALDPAYQGYFKCFNAGQYYEAHDVLEHLWLENGKADVNHAFFKGLIQVAGAFVHMQKQFLRPEHPKDGRRLRPATRLFDLGIQNIEPYGPVHWRLDVAALCQMCRRISQEIVASDFRRNPWTPENAPKLELLPAP